ncbi:MAG: hypothetical protein ABI882_10340 [Acidobacteriota bacterium]
MKTSRRLFQMLSVVCALVVMGISAMAADPGLIFPPTSEVNDQKAGSVLVYNYYTSSSSAPNLTNTRFNLTNTSSTSAAFVHLFFVEGSSCSVSDRFVCLTANQTLTFLASEQDPTTTGFLVAIAANGVNGCPAAFNFLIGDEYVKTDSLHRANLGAEAFAALYNGQLPGCDGNSVTAVLSFDGVVGSGYNRVPRVLAVSSIPSILDGNNTRLIVNRIGGTLVTSSSSVGSVFGLLYDDQEEPHSWNANWGCQVVVQLTNNFPKVAPRFDQVIPAGQTGWMKFWATSDVGIVGAVINQNASVGTAAGAFVGGHNLHKLTLSASNSWTIPIFPPSC